MPADAPVWQRVPLPGNRSMDGASALYQPDLLFRKLGLDISAQITVRQEQNFFVAQLGYDLHRRRGGDTDIADCFQRCGGVDVGDNGMVWVLHLELPHLFPGHLLCHRQPAWGLERKTCFSGDRILTVSAINRTPHIKIFF